MKDTMSAGFFHGASLLKTTLQSKDDSSRRIAGHVLGALSITLINPLRRETQYNIKTEGTGDHTPEELQFLYHKRWISPIEASRNMFSAPWELAGSDGPDGQDGVVEVSLSESSLALQNGRVQMSYI